MAALTLRNVSFGVPHSLARLSSGRLASCRVTRERRKRWIGRALRLLAGLLVLYLVLRWFEHHQVYLPSRRMEATGRELGRPFEDVYFPTTDGLRLHGWFFPADADSAQRHLALLLCHGNAGNISYRLDHAGALLETGASVFLFDYRGYGRSQGRPSEEGTYLDAQAAHAWLRQKGFSGTNIIVIGESLGGGVSSGLALRETIGGLILQSTFTSIPDLGAELFPWLPVRWLGTIRYDTRARLPRIRVPVMILQSRDDTLIRFHHAERNFAAANEPKTLWEIHGDHNSFLEAGRERYRDGIKDFLGRIEEARSKAR
jgi:fermentation-respiration switch protein FrsA (DUF1100 family)